MTKFSSHRGTLSMSNGVHLSHSRQVAHVYYQLFDSKMADGDQLGVSAEARIWYTTPKCIDKRSKNLPDWKVHITLKTQAYDLCSLLFNIIVFVECPSCPDWKENIIKIMMTDQFECAFVTGFRDKTRRICHIYAIHYNWKRRFWS